MRGSPTIPFELARLENRIPLINISVPVPSIGCSQSEHYGRELKGRGHQEVATRTEHRVHVLYRTVGPLQVLEYLVCDDQIEAPLEHLRTDVELWKLCPRVK